jgi:hypothetical protein
VKKSISQAKTINRKKKIKVNDALLFEQEKKTSEFITGVREKKIVMRLTKTRSSFLFHSTAPMTELQIMETTSVSCFCKSPA